MMSAHYDIDKENADFFRIFNRVMTMLGVFVFLSFSLSTYSVLKSNPLYMHDWRGIACIVLTAAALLIYASMFFMSRKMDWPIPWPYAVSIWGGLCLMVILLTLINISFVWIFYIVLSVSFGLFEGRRLILVVSITALMLFGFEGLLIWPVSEGALTSIAGQSLSLVSMTGFCLMFQRMMGERFERNRLVKQLSQTNSELEEAHHQLEQSVAQEQELAVLRERTRLAREMHDTLGHALVLISVKLEAAQRLRERDPERCDREIESTKQIARETMTALRASIADLRSPALERESISFALGRSVRELAQRTGLQVTYTLQPDIGNLPQLVAEVLWKVTQEALTNIEKHAHAKNVEVCISHLDGNLLIQIHDDGIGLPPALCQPQEDGTLICTSPKGHYGLSGMSERVESIGGHLSLRSSKDQGTTIEIKLPLSSMILSKLSRSKQPAQSESMPVGSVENM